MNHYEIVYIFNPDEKELGKSLFDRILETSKSLKGKIHRSEEIGSRRLAYPINDYYRGEYFLINLECNASELSTITDLFKFNENILRTSVLKKKKAETSKSALMEQTSDSSYKKDENPVKKVSNEAKQVLSKTEEVVEEAIEEVKEAAEKVEKVVEEVVEEVVEKTEEIVEAAEEVVEEAIEEVKEAAEKVEEVVEEVVEETKEKAKGVFAKVKNVFKSDNKK